MAVPDAAVYVVLAVCGVAIIILALVLLLWWRRHAIENGQALDAAQLARGEQSAGNNLIMTPAPGKYSAPLDVSCSAAGTAYDKIFVHVSCGTHHEAGFTAFVDPITLTVAGKYVFSVFGATAAGDETAIEKFEYEIVPADGGAGLKPPPGTYTAPLLLDAGDAFRSGSYVAVSPTFPQSTPDGQFKINISGVHVVLIGSSHMAAQQGPARHVYTVLPPAPVIIPNGEHSEITDSTQITICPADPYVDPEATIRYSVDGTHPTVPYIGPFYPPGVGTLGARIKLTVKAVSIGRDGTTSDAVTANFSVLSSGCSVYDPSVPEPSCVVSAADPSFTFEHPGFKKGEPIVIFYTLGPGAEPRQWEFGKKVKMAGSAILEMRAWAVNAASGVRSPDTTYSASRQAMEMPHDATGTKVGKGKKSKVQNNNTKKPLAPQDENKPSTSDVSKAPPLLEAPSIVCSCSAVELRFDPPPVDTYVLRYSLNGTEPDEASPHYVEGSTVDITNEVAMNGGEVYIVARYFCRDEPRPGQPLHVAPVTRFGNCFSRVFSIL